LWDQLQGWRSIGTFFITPLSVAAVYGAIGLPAMIVTNGDYPWLPTQLCGLLTIALGIVLLAGILRFLLGRKPFDFESYSSFDVAEPIETYDHTPVTSSSMPDR
jgi:hypothetical protein